MRSGGLLAEGLVLKSDVELGEKPDMTGFHRWLGCRNVPMAFVVVGQRIPSSNDVPIRTSESL